MLKSTLARNSSAETDIPACRWVCQCVRGPCITSGEPSGTANACHLEEGERARRQAAGGGMAGHQGQRGGAPSPRSAQRRPASAMGCRKLPLQDDSVHRQHQEAMRAGPVQAPRSLAPTAFSRERTKPWPKQQCPSPFYNAKGSSKSGAEGEELAVGSGEVGEEPGGVAGVELYPRDELRVLEEGEVGGEHDVHAEGVGELHLAVGEGLGHPGRQRGVGVGGGGDGVEQDVEIRVVELPRRLRPLPWAETHEAPSVTSQTSLHCSPSRHRPTCHITPRLSRHA